MPKVSITVELDDFVISSNKGEAYEYTISPEKWAAEYVEYLCQYAAGVIVQRSTAGHSATQGGTAEQRIADRKAAVQKILDGVSGRVGGGLSREDAALRDALESQTGFKFLRIDTGKKTEKGNAKTVAEPVAAAFERFVKDLCKKTGQPVNKNTTAQILDRLKQTSAYKLAMGNVSDDITAHFTKTPESDESE